jgi:hypothetical protein
MRRAALGALALLLVGCTSADPNAWLLYSRANYLYGRMEAKTELLCTPAPAKVSLLDYCQEASRTREAIRAINPTIQAELVKKQVDWQKLMGYLDLVLSLAAKTL